MIAERAKALVLMTSPLDMISHSLRAVASFKEKLPMLDIAWVARAEFEPALRCFECVDRVIAFDRSGGLAGAIRLARRLRQERFDCVLDFEGHARTGLMALAARCPRKVGRSDAREGATVFYSELAPRPTGGGEHILEAMLEFGRLFGIEPRLGQVPVLRVEVRPPPAWLQPEGGGRRLCIFPGRYKEARAWPRFYELAERLLETDERARVFALGSYAVAPPIELLRRFGDRFVDQQGKLSWAETIGMISQADLVVANDNGPAQLAAALGRPNLTLYTAALPERRGSYPLGAPGHGIVRAPGGWASRLELATVWEAVEKLLASGAGLDSPCG